MNKKRFSDDGFEAIEEQSFTDNHTGKTYYVDYFDDIIELCNSLAKENESLKKEIENNSAFFKEVNRKRLELEEENEQLKQQLYCSSDEGICTICKHHYLEKGKTYDQYYISKCKKGHEECSKIDLKYCDDFELKEGDVE